jgi:FtsP/CotA-like multicopper oxidase with cupredoxin domain
MLHVAPERRLAADGSGQAVGARADHGAHADHAGHDASLGMSGMVLGITVTPRAGAGAPVPAAIDTAAPAPGLPVRRLTMDIHAASDDGRAPAGITVTEADAPEPADARASADGPQPVVLRRGEPVEITLVNHLAEPTSMHWHGLELDSVYDGVHGWSGDANGRAPMIAPGGSFVVRLTPPRAGTFIYHTHVHDYRQLTSGLYGPLLVLEPGERWDPATDHVVVLGRRDADDTSAILRDAPSAVINGVHDGRWAWQAGASHRLRLINITPDDIWTVSLQGADGAATWRPLTKDGAPVPSSEARAGSARVTIAVGETYDFAYDAAPGRRTLFLEARGTDGTWQSQARIQFR